MLIWKGQLKYFVVICTVVQVFIESLLLIPLWFLLFSKDNTALACIKGFMLHHLSNDWQPEDFKFLKEISLPELLINLAKSKNIL